MSKTIELLTSEDGLRKIADEIIEDNNITSITSREAIEECVKDYMDGQDDYLYYNEDFNNADIKNRIADNIVQQASFVKPLIEDKEKTSKLFEQMVDDFCLENRYNVSKELIQTIRTLISNMKSNAEDEDTLTLENIKKWEDYAYKLNLFVFGITDKKPERPEYIKYKEKNYVLLSRTEADKDSYVVFLQEVKTHPADKDIIISVKIKKENELC